jgi:N-acetylmuramoyl-L-alanine amidase
MPALRLNATFAALAVCLTAANCAPASESRTAAMSRSPEASTLDAARAALADPEVACLAEAIYFEARGTSPDGQAAVAHVVLNRAENDEFPSTVCGVVSDRCQFSYRCNGESNALVNPQARAEAVRIAAETLSRSTDITKGALFFHSARATATGWLATRPRVGQFGGNVFYR